MTTITLDDAELQAFGQILDLAHGDQQSYLEIGNPATDYGDDWPESAAAKAETFLLIAQLAARLGINGELERWTNLSNCFRASGREYDEAHQ